MDAVQILNVYKPIKKTSERHWSMYRTMNTQDRCLTFLLVIVASLLTLSCHDFKQSLEDAAKVTSIVGLQLIGNTCTTAATNIGYLKL